MAEREDISARFDANLDRVKSLIAIYEERAKPSTPGRRTVQDSDLLRAAVILLHASLEDLLRSLAEWKLPTGPSEGLAELPLIGTGGRNRFGLKELAELRGKNVDEVIADSVAEFLERSNYSHPGDIRAMLQRIRIDHTVLDPFAGLFATMITRRHWIFHQADRNPRKGPGQHRAKSISLATVLRWLSSVERFGRATITLS